MNNTELSRAYAALMVGRRSGSAIELPPERILAVVEGVGSDAERVATLDAVLANPSMARELELLRAIGANRPRARAPWVITPLLLAAAAAVLFVAIPAVRDEIRISQPEPLRDAAQAAMLIAPPQMASAEESRTFRWRAAPGGRAYALEILTAAGTPVFTTRTRDTTVTLPADVRLAPGAEHWWWVATEFDDGTQRRSPFRRLMVRAAK